MSNLLAVKGPNIGLKYSLGDVTTIGRAEDNTVHVPDPNVSRYHCKIVRKGMSFRIEDVNSRNGILVNGTPATAKTLLRNDQIAVGPSVFLFNPDCDLKNTRFSDRRVHFASPTDETLVRLPSSGPVEAIDAATTADSQNRTNMVALVCHLADLFASSAALPLPEALERILQTLLGIFGAHRGCLLIWDTVSGEFVPMVTLAEEEEFTLSQNVIRSVMEEKRAVLVATPSRDPATQNALCVPLLRESEIRGLLYMELASEQDLLLADVRLVQAVADLTQSAVESVQTRDRLERRASRNADLDDGPVGRSREFKNAMELAHKVAASDTTVLLAGETGTGKEVFAHEIHRLGKRRDFPFVAVNCAAIPEGLIESELFGHERGSFTGADRMRRGLIETAHGGTLFLDEVGEMPLSTQTKLLRFLQERAITRVGGHRPISVDVRIVAASNADLRAAIEQKRFREDLWYRLNVFAIELPPLRERREDIQPLAERFLRQSSHRVANAIVGLSQDAVRILENYDWPGNIRELQNAVERAAILCDDGVLRPEHFHFGACPSDESNVAAREEQPTEVTALAEAERLCILGALRASGWNQVQAARQLRIHRNTLRKKIADYGLRPVEPRV